MNYGSGYDPIRAAQIKALSSTDMEALGSEWIQGTDGLITHLIASKGAVADVECPCGRGTAKWHPVELAVSVSIDDTERLYTQMAELITRWRPHREPLTLTGRVYSGVHPALCVTIALPAGTERDTLFEYTLREVPK